MEIYGEQKLNEFANVVINLSSLSLFFHSNFIFHYLVVDQALLKRVHSHNVCSLQSLFDFKAVLINSMTLNLIERELK